MARDEEASQQSPSDESETSDEDVDTDDVEAFVLNDRRKQGVAQDDSDEDEDDDDDDEDDDEEADEEEQEDGNEQHEVSRSSGSVSDSESESDGSTQPQDLTGKARHQFMLQKRKNEEASKHELPANPSKKRPTDEQATKKVELEGPHEMEEKLASKKRKKDNTSGKTEQVAGSKKVKKGEDHGKASPNGKITKLEQEGKPSQVEESGKLEQLVKLARVGKDGKAGKENQNSLRNGGKRKGVEETFRSPSPETETGVSKKSPKPKRSEKSASELNGPKSEKKPEKLVVTETAGKVPLSPVKHKLWTPDDEIVLSSGILKDVKLGFELPNKKNDEYWSKLLEKLRKKLEGDWTKEQLCEKVKRMKTRYHGMAEKVKDSVKPYNFRNKTDPILFELWSQLWGNGTAGISEDHGQQEEEEKHRTQGISADERKPVSQLKEDDTPKVKLAKKQRSKTHESEVEELKENLLSQENGDTTLPKEVDHTVAFDNGASVRTTKVSTAASHKHVGFSNPTSQDLEELQKQLRVSLEGLQNCANGVSILMETISKTAGDQLRSMHTATLAGVGGFSFTPFTSFESDCSQDKVLQQKWCKLHLQELDLYSQRLQLMQEECKVKQEQLKLQLEANK